MKMVPRLYLLALALASLAGCAGGPLPTPTQLRAASPTPVAAPTRPASTPEATPTTAPTPADRFDLAAPNVFAYITPQGDLALATPAGDQLEIWDGANGAAAGAAWSPAGTLLAFVAARRLYLWRLDDGEPQPLLDNVAAPPSWSADGRAIAVATGEEGLAQTLVVVDVESEERRTLGSGANPRFAPQGEALLASTAPDQALPMREGPAAAPMLWTSQDTAPLVLESAYSLMDWGRVAWTADGTLAPVSNLLIRSDGQIEQELGPALNSAEAGQANRYSIGNGISPDGRWVAVATLAIGAGDGQPGGSKQTDLVVLDRSSGERRAVWQSDPAPGHDYSWQLSRVGWSPDSRTLIFTGAGTTLGSDPLHADALWMGTADGSELAPLPGSEGATGIPLFAPDGSYVLFTVGQSDQAIWGWQVGGKEPPHGIVAGSAPAWRPR